MSFGHVEKMRSHHPHRARSKQATKRATIRRERRRVKLDISAPPLYKKMDGWED